MEFIDHSLSAAGATL